MNEPSVALTDYVLAMISLGFAWNIYISVGKKNMLILLFCLFYLSGAVASFLGGTVHGFFVDKSTLGYHLLWVGTLLAIGITAVSCWLLGGFFLHGPKQLSKWLIFSSGLFLIYAGAVIFYTQNFSLAVLNYLPAILFFLIVMIYKLIQTTITSFRWIMIGILISFLAAAVQQTGFNIHPTFLNHNSLYHLLQALGFWFIFIGARGLVTLDRSSLGFRSYPTAL
ncbi:MAG: hypothetical protein H0W64_05100 [Gammaproteobacteria bacterium]|nr:hypothetical protein [Gammaproteobacteria bacterium]